MVRIELDESLCIGSGHCALTAPDVFDQRDEDGVSVILQQYPAAESLDQATTAVARCPAAALRLVEGSG